MSYQGMIPMATAAELGRSADAWIWAAMLPAVPGDVRPPSCPPTAADVRRLSEVALLRSCMPASESEWQQIQDRIHELEDSE